MLSYIGPYYVVHSPLALRRGLRDHWDDPQSPTRKAIARLSVLLGLQVSVDLEVAMLWVELQNYFPDEDVFVPTITGVVMTWVECLIDRLENEANSNWSDKLLEYVGHSGRNPLKVKVEVCPPVLF